MKLLLMRNLDETTASPTLMGVALSSIDWETVPSVIAYAPQANIPIAKITITRSMSSTRRYNRIILAKSVYLREYGKRVAYIPDWERLAIKGQKLDALEEESTFLS